MEMRVQLSGSVIFATKIDCVPTVGSVVKIRTQNYRSGLFLNSVISIPISNENPPELDYSEGSELIVFIDANGYSVLEMGQSPD
jgi:hypothetical protein